MKASVLSITYFLALLWTLAAGASIPRYFEKNQITRRDLTTTQVQHELGGQVSNTTSIFGPDDGRFKKTTSRWTTFSKPQIQVVVEPGSESDVATIVRLYAPQPFLTKETDPALLIREFPRSNIATRTVSTF